MKKLFVIDATGFLFRSYFAIRNMTNPKGEATNALYGFIRSVLKLIKDFEPTHLVAVFDGPNNKKKRQEIFANYKANRSAPPEDLPPQLYWAQDFCKAFGIPILSLPDVEADDVMGTIAQWASQKKTHTFLCTSDKDMAQAVNESVSLLHVHRDNRLLDPQGVLTTYGIHPSQMIDFLAITGDTSDHIPGLPGFGPKTAQQLLSTLGSLQEILEHPEKVPGNKKQQTIVTHREQALMSQKLVQLMLDCEIPEQEDFYRFNPTYTSELYTFYQTMNFKSLLQNFPTQETDSPSSTHKPTLSTSYQCISSIDELKSTLTSLSSLNLPICIDIETTSPHPIKAEIVGIGLCIEPTKAFYIPFNAGMQKKEIVTLLFPFFGNQKNSFYGHDIKYDLHLLQNTGLPLPKLAFDTMVASYLLRANNHRHSLAQLTLEYFDKEKIPYESIVGKGKKAIPIDQIPIETMSNYCCESVDYTYRLKNCLEEQLQEEQLDSLFYELELPLIPILLEIEREGIYLKQEDLLEQKEHVNKILKELTEKIYQQAGEEFNIKSPKQLSHILFEKLNIHPPKKTATGYSTNADVLEKLQTNYPIATDLLSFRQLEKLRSTYLEALPEEINPITNRIHCSFNQSVAATGRLSCQNPNLQTIPIRTELGRNIRKAFCPEKKGWSFLSADYSQIELRLLAHLSQDPQLLKAFQCGEDIHAYTASLVFNLPLNEVSKSQRQQAKTVNFGILYGQQAFGLSKELQISIKEAQKFIETYFERYPNIASFLETCKKKTKETGYTTTMFGRKRMIPDMESKNPIIRQAAERLAINTPIQGTGADIIKKAMLQIAKRLQKEQKQTKIILQIHDELLFEAPDHELSSLKQLVKEGMENVVTLSIPLTVDIHVGKNWKDC